ncbi:hypothetical protein [Microbacterium hydrocarbonoxydans]|uniref:hypothetical protein n=1 Tax=Microbacterium hydrocarbonoxydans TaxID=273678 RepID=UPI00203CE335|nr:hypothetical protein [Microbacterium hydrocarbonoxydans]MCM3780391.1 hypothetical protein [Microbacterium hydrocarbonoxydans]
MAARGSRNAQRARTEAERVRLHNARRDWHVRQIARRTRDNVIAVVAGVIIVAGAVVSQVVHAQVTAPEPTPTPSPGVEQSEAPGEQILPSETPAPEPVPTQTPAE